MRSLLPAAVLLGSGVLSALGFAPFNLWPLTLASCALLIGLTFSARTLRIALAGGWLFGVGQFALSLDWIPTAFNYQDKMPKWLGIAGTALLCLYLAIYPSMACALAWWVSRGERVRFVLFFAAAWILTEFLRGTVFTGFPWNPLGVVWVPLSSVAQSARWIGTYGLSAVVILAAGALWLLSRREWRAALAIALAASALPMLGWVSYRIPTAIQGGFRIPVRVVQPNIAQNEKTDPAARARNAGTYASLSGAPGGTPRVLLWPEAATESFLQMEPEARAALAKLLGPKDVLLIGGESVFSRPPNDLAYYNSVFAVDARGGLLWRYDKAHLVPFGEYLPLRPILSRIGLSRLVAGEGDFNRGPGPRTFQIPGFGSVGVQVCYEIIFSGHVIDRTHRPDFLFNPSNDAWFGSSGPPQHLAQAQLRAIEEGIPVVRATPNGISAVIDPMGNLVATVPRHQMGVIDTLLPLAREPTIFARLGLWASALFGVGLCVVALALGRFRRVPISGARVRMGFTRPECGSRIGRTAFPGTY
jgi:apolipoprotein N-acyltransferase